MMPADHPPVPTFDTLDTVITQAVQEERIVGTVVLVAHHGQIVYQRAAGWADREAKKPMQPDTIFRLSSVTKPMVTAAAMRLEEEGRLPLQAPVTRWLPDFRPSAPQAVQAEASATAASHSKTGTPTASSPSGSTGTDQASSTGTERTTATASAEPRRPTITIEQLITHTSGLSYSFMEDRNSPYARAKVSDGLNMAISLAENLKRLGSVPLVYEPGKGWRYSLSIDVLGGAMEAETHQSLPDIVRETVTGPLGMKDTGFAVTDPDRLAVPYKDAPAKDSATAPTSGRNGTNASGSNTHSSNGDTQTSDGNTHSSDSGHDDNHAEAARAAPRSRAAIRMQAQDTLDTGSGILNFDNDHVWKRQGYPSGGGGMVGTAPDFMKFLLSLRPGAQERVLKPETVARMMQPHVNPAWLDFMKPGWSWGYGWAVLDDPTKAHTPMSRGTLQWGGVYGHHWFYDPVKDVAVVAFTNTSVEGMNGPFTTEVVDAVYAAVNGSPK